MSYHTEFTVEDGFLIERWRKTGDELDRTPVPAGHVLCDLCDGDGELCGWYDEDVICEPCDQCDGAGHTTPERNAEAERAWEEHGRAAYLARINAG